MYGITGLRNYGTTERVAENQRITRGAHLSDLAECFRPQPSLVPGPFWPPKPRERSGEGFLLGVQEAVRLGYGVVDFVHVNGPLFPGVANVSVVLRLTVICGR